MAHPFSSLLKRVLAYPIGLALVAPWLMVLPRPAWSQSQQNPTNTPSTRASTTTSTSDLGRISRTLERIESTAYAHRQTLLHRSLQENLITRFGETAAGVLTRTDPRGRWQELGAAVSAVEQQLSHTKQLYLGLTNRIETIGSANCSALCRSQISSDIATLNQNLRTLGEQFFRMETAFSSTEAESTRLTQRGTGEVIGVCGGGIVLATGGAAIGALSGAGAIAGTSSAALGAAGATSLGLTGTLAAGIDFVTREPNVPLPQREQSRFLMPSLQIPGSPNPSPQEGFLTGTSLNENRSQRSTIPPSHQENPRWHQWHQQLRRQHNLIQRWRRELREEGIMGSTSQSSSPRSLGALTQAASITLSTRGENQFCPEDWALFLLETEVSLNRESRGSAHQRPRQTHTHDYDLQQHFWRNFVAQMRTSLSTIQNPVARLNHLALTFQQTWQRMLRNQTLQDELRDLQRPQRGQASRPPSPATAVPDMAGCLATPSLHPSCKQILFSSLICGLPIDLPQNARVVLGWPPSTNPNPNTPGNHRTIETRQASSPTTWHRFLSRQHQRPSDLSEDSQLLVVLQDQHRLIDLASWTDVDPNQYEFFTNPALQQRLYLEQMERRQIRPTTALPPAWQGPGAYDLTATVRRMLLSSGHDPLTTTETAVARNDVGSPAENGSPGTIPNSGLNPERQPQERPSPRATPTPQPTSTPSPSMNQNRFPEDVPLLSRSQILEQVSGALPPWRTTDRLLRLDWISLKAQLEAWDANPRPSPALLSQALRRWRHFLNLVDHDLRALPPTASAEDRIALVVNRVVSAYSQRYAGLEARLLSVLFGGEGNCQTSTQMLFGALSMLGVYPDPPQRFAVHNFTDHVELVVYNPQNHHEVWDLVSGTRAPHGKGDLYQTALIGLVGLRTHGGRTPFTNEQVLLRRSPLPPDPIPFDRIGEGILALIRMQGNNSWPVDLTRLHLSGLSAPDHASIPVPYQNGLRQQRSLSQASERTPSDTPTPRRAETPQQNGGQESRDSAGTRDSATSPNLSPLSPRELALAHLNEILAGSDTEMAGYGRRFYRERGEGFSLYHGRIEPDPSNAALSECAYSNPSQRNLCVSLQNFFTQGCPFRDIRQLRPYLGLGRPDDQDNTVSEDSLARSHAYLYEQWLSDRRNPDPNTSSMRQYFRAANDSFDLTHPGIARFRSFYEATSQLRSAMAVRIRSFMNAITEYIRLYSPRGTDPDLQRIIRGSSLINCYSLLFGEPSNVTTGEENQGSRPFRFLGYQIPARNGEPRTLSVTPSPALEQERARAQEVRLTMGLEWISALTTNTLYGLENPAPLESTPHSLSFALANSPHSNPDQNSSGNENVWIHLSRISQRRPYSNGSEHLSATINDWRPVLEAMLRRGSLRPEETLASTPTSVAATFWRELEARLRQYFIFTFRGTAYLQAPNFFRNAIAQGLFHLCERTEFHNLATIIEIARQDVSSENLDPWDRLRTFQGNPGVGLSTPRLQQPRPLNRNFDSPIARTAFLESQKACRALPLWREMRTEALRLGAHVRANPLGHVLDALGNRNAPNFEIEALAESLSTIPSEIELQGQDTSAVSSRLNSGFAGRVFPDNSSTSQPASSPTPSADPDHDHDHPEAESDQRSNAQWQALINRQRRPKNLTEYLTVQLGHGGLLVPSAPPPRYLRRSPTTSTPEPSGSSVDLPVLSIHPAPPTEPRQDEDWQIWTAPIHNRPPLEPRIGTPRPPQREASGSVNQMNLESSDRRQSHESSTLLPQSSSSLSNQNDPIRLPLESYFYLVFDTYSYNNDALWLMQTLRGRLPLLQQRVADIRRRGRHYTLFMQAYHSGWDHLFATMPQPPAHQPSIEIPLASPRAVRLSEELAFLFAQAWESHIRDSLTMQQSLSLPRTVEQAILHTIQPYLASATGSCQASRGYCFRNLESARRFFETMNRRFGLSIPLPP